jgi:Holliday junction DNA helicase RuvA
MIGKLKGVVDSVDEENLILDVGGVGYLVSASARTLRALPAVGEAAELLIETHVREDAIRLYGFLDAQEREWFRLLQSVQGVGAKVALGILGALSSYALSAAIAKQDKAMMARAPGVGPKLAARLVLELKDKALVLGPGGFAGVDVAPEPARRLPRAAEDAILALVGLGYTHPQAAAAVARISVELGREAETAAFVRAGLKELTQ